MCKSSTILTSLNICQKHIQFFFKELYALDIEKLDMSQRLKILVFYEELVNLLHNNTSLIEAGTASLPLKSKQKSNSNFNSS